jgi:hypothetical protein
MTNIVPQSPASDQKAWEWLESYCREQVDDSSRQPERGRRCPPFQAIVFMPSLVVEARQWAW